MTAKAGREPRLLILCVDRDDDVGVKTKIKTPIVGRERCLEAASRLAVVDPEEADANAIFAAVSEFDKLKAKGYACEVAIATGLKERGVEGDKKLREEIMLLNEASGPDGVVLVTDGAEDEAVLPILHDIVPVVSTKRVVIKHSRSVEESYLVLGRYLKMLVYDPRYSKFALGLPGLLMVVTGLLLNFGLGKEAIVVVSVILGLALILRGFDIDKKVGALTRLRPSSYVRLFSAVASGLVLVTGFTLAFSAISKMPEFGLVSSDPGLFLSQGSRLVGTFLLEALPLLWIGLGLNFFGSLLTHWFKGSIRALRDAVGLIMLGLLYFPISQFSLILKGEGSAVTLVTLLLVGLAFTFLAVSVAYQYILKRRPAEAGA